MDTRFFGKGLFHKTNFCLCFWISAFNFSAILFSIPGGEKWNHFKRLVIGQATSEKFFPVYFWIIVSVSFDRISIFIYQTFYFTTGIANRYYRIFYKDCYTLPG